MKYIYLFIWNFLAFVGYQLDSKILIPFVKLTKYRTLKSNGITKKRLKSIDEAKNSFPSGIRDWYASTFLVGFILIPFMILPSYLGYKFNSDKEYTIYFVTVFTFSLGLVYYSLYIKNKEWLKREIKKRRKKYSLDKLEDE